MHEILFRNGSLHCMRFNERRRANRACRDVELESAASL